MTGAPRRTSGGSTARPEAEPAVGAIGSAARVWDPLVRSLHWLLVTAVALAWATTAWMGDQHRAAGWVALGIVALRAVWGCIGPRHARFTNFVRGPAATLRYGRRVLAGTEPRHLGHNPLGAVMVLAIFFVVAALALSGWLYTTDAFWGSEAVERWHAALAWVLVALAMLHVAGVTLASRRHHENLVAAMVIGTKRPPGPEDVA